MSNIWHKASNKTTITYCNVYTIKVYKLLQNQIVRYIFIRKIDNKLVGMRFAY